MWVCVCDRVCDRVCVCDCVLCVASHAHITLTDVWLVRINL